MDIIKLVLCIAIPVIVVVFICIMLKLGYVKAAPDTALIISGMRRQNKILIGKAGWRVPFFERVDKLSLNVMQVDVKTSEPVPTNEFINVTVDGVANVKISSSPENLGKAAESLLGINESVLLQMITQVLEGNMREIVGSVSLRSMVQNRQEVAEKIKENAVPDMAKLGIEIVNFNIQNFRDQAGTIENLGIDNVEQIRKSAAMAKAEAKRDIAIAEAKAEEESNAVRVETSKKIAAQDAALMMEQAEMKRQADIKKAEADAAYKIQEEQQRKTIEISSAEADIARTEQQAIIAEREISLTERKLDAEIRKKADALKYQSEQEAQADLIRRQKDAEAKRYEQEQEAAAQRALAEAACYAKELEAKGIRAVGEAEAEAIEKKAEAQKKFGEASVLEMYFQMLPEAIKSAAAPLSQTDKIVMYGSGNSPALVGDVMKTANQIFEAIKESTGIDIESKIADLISKTTNK